MRYLLLLISLAFLYACNPISQKEFEDQSYLGQQYNLYKFKKTWSELLNNNVFDSIPDNENPVYGLQYINRSTGEINFDSIENIGLTGKAFEHINNQVTVHIGEIRRWEIDNKVETILVQIHYYGI